MLNLKVLRPYAILSSIVATIGIATIVSTSAPASAVSLSSPPPVWFGYRCISNNNTSNCQTGQNQFRTKVSQVVSTNNTVKVLFEFFNRPRTGTTARASSITGVYFDDPSPFSLDFSAPKNAPIITSSSGVSFSRQLSRRGVAQNLPGGTTISFDSDYTVGANAPVQPNGVNLGESLSILFNTEPRFKDPFNAVITDLQKGSLRVGIHGQGFANGGSESFVNEAVPEPMTMLGSGIALGFGGLLKRRAAKNQKIKA